MSDGTPTVGDLKRENEELRRENEDLKARMDTVEEQLGLLDGEDSGQDIDERVERAVREGIQDAERRNRRRTASTTINDGREYTREYEDEDYRPYEDPSPSFVGEDSVQVIEKIERPVFVGDEIFYDDDQGRPTVGNDWVHCGCGEYHIDVSECGPIYEFGAVCPECDNHFGWSADPEKSKEEER